MRALNRNGQQARELTAHDTSTLGRLMTLFTCSHQITGNLIIGVKPLDPLQRASVTGAWRAMPSCQDSYHAVCVGVLVLTPSPM